MNSMLILDNFLFRYKKSAAPSEKLVELLKAGGWDVRTASDKGSRLLRCMDFCVKCLQASGRSVTLINIYSGLYFWMASAAALILKMSGKPYVLMLRGGSLPDFARRHEGSVKRILASAAAVAAPSEYLRQKMARYCKGDIIIIPNGIEVGKYPFRSRKIVEPKLIWLRSFHKMYNPGLAIEVLSLLKADFPDMRLQMVGLDRDGSYRQVVNKARDSGLLEYVEFNPGIDKDDVPARLNSGDLFINTTNIDNAPVSVIEAMACGLCVISTSVGGIPYLLEDNVDALLVPPNDAKAMADAVRRILNSPELAGRLSHAARQKAEKFDWPIVFKKWEHMFANRLR